MKFGVREICDVVLKAKAAQKIGNKVFYKNEPVCYFDSLKTSSMEGASTTVYAQGGRGNARLVAWEGERTVTFTMEDALISQTGLMILTGAGLIEASASKPIIVHTTEQTDEVYPTLAAAANAEAGIAVGDITKVDVYLKQKPYLPSRGTVTGAIGAGEARGIYDYIYVMLLKDGEIITEPYIPDELTEIAADSTHDKLYKISIHKSETESAASDNVARINEFAAWSKIDKDNVVLVDYYVAKESGAYQVNITPETFGGNFYLEASTLFRDTNGVDMPAEFVIPNCKVQSNFTFTMASSGDPSTFTFTMDAFPDYTRFDKSKKVLAAIQIIDAGGVTADFERLGTDHSQNNIWAGAPANSEGKKQYNYFEEGGRG